MSSLQLPAIHSNGLLVLIGGGEFSFQETREIDEFLISKMPGDRQRIAFLPTASGSPEYASRFGAYMKSLSAGIEFTNVPVYRTRDARRERNLDLIRSAGLIYIGAGMTNLLLDVIRDSAVIPAFHEALRGGGVIAGIAGGAAAFGIAARDMRASGPPLPGLGWVRDAVIEPGFNPENDAPLRRMMSIEEVRTGVGIPQGTAVAISPGGMTEIIGNGQLAVLRKP